MKNISHTAQALFIQIYGKEIFQEYAPKIEALQKKWKKNTMIRKKTEQRKNAELFSEKDSVLITYGNSIVEKNEKPLRTLHKFLHKYEKKHFSTVHILPFFPSSSDFGFAVKDFRTVDKKLGDWKDIENISKDYRIMADVVLNHISTESEWFQKFLAGDKKYTEYFLAFDTPQDTSKVFRTRTHPLLTPFDTKDGKKYVWSTFSTDQIDLNYHNPTVFLEMIDIACLYLSHGVEILRLDAVGFLWKDLNTESIHLPQTHALIQLFREIVCGIAPYAVIITETNVRYEENISYFGEKNEAHAVYGFDLPPLITHAFFKKNTSFLQNFYKKRSSEKGIFLNFLASHDGIGLLGAKNIVPDAEIDELVKEIMHNREGFISYKAIADEDHPYELNVSFFDALNKTFEESTEANRKFIAAHAICFFLQGIPAVYIHSFLGSRNNYEEARRKGIKRLINRAQIDWQELEETLAEPSSRRVHIIRGMHKMIDMHTSHQCFSPKAQQNIVQSDPRIFHIEREHNGKKLVLIVNVSNEKIDLPVYKGQYQLLGENNFSGKIKPYQALVFEE